MASAAVQQSGVEVSAQDTYTFTEAWQRLGMSERTFSYHVHQGTIRQQQGGGYLKADVEQLVQVRAQRQATAPEGYCTADAGRRLLGVTTGTFLTYVWRGKISYQQLSDVSRCYCRADIDRLIAKRAAHRERIAGPIPPTYYTMRQAQTVLQVVPSTLRRFVNLGMLQRISLPERKHGVYEKAQVDALAATRQAEQAARPHGHPDRWSYNRLYTSVFAAHDAQAGTMSQFLRYLVTWSHWPVEDVEDIVQQEFIKLWEDGVGFFTEFPRLENQRRLFSHRCQQAIALERRARGTRRKALFEAGVEQVLVHHRYPSVEQEVLGRERWQVVLRELRRHPVKRQVIAQMLARGFTVDEIVAYLRQHDLGLSKKIVSTYRTQMAQAMQRALAKWDEAHAQE